MDYITQLEAFDNLSECSISFLISCHSRTPSLIFLFSSSLWQQLTISVAFHSISEPIPWSFHPWSNVNSSMLKVWCILLYVGAWVLLSSYGCLVVLPIYRTCFILFYHCIKPNYYFCYHWMRVNTKNPIQSFLITCKTAWLETSTTISIFLMSFC